MIMLKGNRFPEDYGKTGAGGTEAEERIFNKQAIHRDSKQKFYLKTNDRIIKYTH